MALFDVAFGTAMTVGSLGPTPQAEQPRIFELTAKSMKPGLFRANALDVEFDTPMTFGSLDTSCRPAAPR